MHDNRHRGKPRGGQRQRTATRRLFDWLNAVKADDAITPGAFIVAFEIGQHFNAKHGGAAWPSLKTIAANTRVDKATVVRAVRQLCERGHLDVEPGKPGRGGHSNRYRMASGEKTKVHQRTFSMGSKGAFSRNQRCASAPELSIEPSMSGPPSAAPDGERERRSLALASPPGARTPVGGAPHREVEVIAPGDYLAELQALWSVRPWPDTAEDDAAARKAFAVACRDADPDEIIAGAHAWVTAAADEPRFLPKLAKWLTGRSWAKPPPARRKQRGKNPSLTETALRIVEHRWRDRS